MSEEILNQEAESPAVEEEQLQESQVEETVEVSEDETLEEMSHGKKKGEEEEEHEDDGVKVKIMKVHSGDMKGMMDEMLGHGGPNDG